VQPIKTLLTNDNLRKHADGNTTQQGQEYFSQNHVRLTHQEDTRVNGQVADPTTSQTYNVQMTGSDFGLSWQCSCGSNGGSSGEGIMCPHTYAVALAAQRY
jgi:uncharacterized Zn finger protein